jgi:hypothetical protein
MTKLDRYDRAISWLMAIFGGSALVLNAPLWTVVLICVVGCCTVFIRHIDEFRVR